METTGFFERDNQQFRIDVVLTHTDANGKYGFEYLCRGPRRVWAGWFDTPGSAEREIDRGGLAEVVFDVRVGGP
jgi:hypothetical protein